MASPIDNNPFMPASNAAETSENVNRTTRVNPSATPATNIPNDGQNYHWFLSENTGSRTPISATEGPTNTITAAMGVDGIATRILSHLGA